MFGDEGGAFDIVRRAIRAALQFEESWGSETVLRHELLSATGIATADELMHMLYTPEWPRSRSATLAPIVTAAADAGDAVARRILDEAAEKLAWYAKGVYSRLFSGPVLVSPVGGAFQSVSYRSAFEAALKNTMPCRVVSPRLDPARGALLLARRL